MKALDLYFIIPVILTILFIGWLIHQTMMAFNLRKCLKEGFEEPVITRCPNMLIEKDGKIYLYNSQLVNVPGVNPIQFNNLEEYTEFLKWQKSVNINCPVLYLQYTNDTQGKNVYKLRNDYDDTKYGAPPVTSVNSKYGVQPITPITPITQMNLMNSQRTLLVDAGRDGGKYNINNLPGYDAHDQYIGLTTPLDEMNDYKRYQLSTDNAMMDNWDSAIANKHIDEGVYNDNNVRIRVA
jgi:hypothetical protein